ncbi:MAG: hypothetical protein M3536_10915 [Actinomycetota bacterium]|nr:hypothetical protein [Actinomycetota bacterium]
MSNNGLDAFKKRGQSKFATFQQAGATVAGTITEISDQKQATKWNPDKNAKRELDFWPSMDPVMEVWITVQTNERDPQDPEDTGLRAIVITVNQKPGGQLAAIMDACEAVGSETPLPGGFLALTFTHFDPESKNPQNPRKLYAAKYQAPAPGGGAFQQPAAQAAPPVQQAPQYNQWNPAPEQQAYVQAPMQPPAQYSPQQQAAPPAWAQPAAQAAPPVQPPAVYQPPVQVDTNTGELAPQAQYVPPVQQQAPAQAAPAQQGGGVDAQQIQALIVQGMDDATIQQTTGAPMAAISAIRSLG